MEKSKYMQEAEDFARRLVHDANNYPDYGTIFFSTDSNQILGTILGSGKTLVKLAKAMLQQEEMAKAIMIAILESSAANVLSKLADLKQTNKQDDDTTTSTETMA